MSELGAAAIAVAGVKPRHCSTVGTAFALALPSLLIVAMATLQAQAEDRVEPYRAAREAYITGFRISGARDPAPLARLQYDLQSLVAATSGAVQAEALVELGSVQRLSNEFPEAISTLTRAAESGTRLGRSETAFNGWIEVARAHIVGTHDHGAGQAAMDRAVAAAGSHPTPEQRYDIARYDSEGSVARGEIDAGLVGALDAGRLAPTAGDRFYGQFDAGDALQKLAESCDYRQLKDRLSTAPPGDDGWGACRRAVTAARAAYDRAARTADDLGWKFLAGQARQTVRDLEKRRQLIEQRAHSLPASQAANFAPHDAKDVLVHKGDFARRYLSAAFTGLSGRPDLLALAQQTVAYAARAPGSKDNSLNVDLRGTVEEMKGGKPEAAAALFTQAADLLARQRASFFDARRRGTVIEGDRDLFSGLALRLLALRRDDEAFAAFEAVRARGLGEMAQALGKKDVTAADRASLAELLRLEAETSAVETRIVEQVIADGRPEASPEDLSHWETSQSDRVAYLQEHKEIRDRFARTSFAPASLEDLQRVASRTGIPVLLYWVANPDVIVWYVGPHGSEVRIVFLPEVVLTGTIAKLTGTIAVPGKAFDAVSARELYLYLVAPLEDLLADTKEVMIVPQGPIVGLPFEALVEPGAGGFLVDRWVVSYAPNATMALDALNRVPPTIKRVTAILDIDIDDFTHESKGIGEVPGLQLNALYSSDVLPGKLGESFIGADGAHLLLHGEFDALEPLLSTLTETSHRSPPLPATALLSLPLNGMKLVVLSACESGALQVRISNEIYGFPWALLAAGAENVVTSRWRVDGASNGRWMRSFYTAIANGSSPAVAAADAMRGMRKEEGSHPYLWAAMQVNGR